MDQYRVFGNPIAQSKSPFIHRAFAQQQKLNLNYQKQLVAIDQFQQAVKHLMVNHGIGANVTVPFKEQAYKLCDRLTNRAKLSGAVNTLTFKDGLIWGDNTDGVGLVNDLLLHKVQLQGSRILLLGAGGAAKGVIPSLLEQQPHSITIANRTLARAEQIVSQYPNENVKAKSYQHVTETNYQLIINATSTGLTGTTLPIPDPVIASADVCYDMVYGAQLTSFLRQAQQLAVPHVIDGLGMLLGQAAESFYVWTGRKPDITPIQQALRAQLSSQEHS